MAAEVGIAIEASGAGSAVEASGAGSAVVSAAPEAGQRVARARFSRSSSAFCRTT